MISKTRFACLTTFLLVAALSACGTDDAGEAAANAPETFRSAIQVQTRTVGLAKLMSETEVSGTVSAFRKATLAAEIAASVERRLIEPGQLVEEGAVLLKLDAETARNQYREAKAQLIAREVALESAGSELKRGLELIEKKFISQDGLEDLEFAQRAAVAQRDAAAASVALAREQLHDSSIRAPFAGTVEAVMVQQGDFLSPGQAVATLADFSKLRITAGVSARQTSMFKIGQTVGLSFPGLGLSEVQADIASIGRIANAGTGNYPMEIWLDGEKFSQVREGMVASIRAEISSEQDVIQIPSRAVLRRNGQTMVFVADAGVAQARFVTPGRTTVDVVEIMEGLSAGEEVIVDGQFALRDGAPIEAMQ